MTLNDVMAFMLPYFTKFGSFGDNHITVIEVSPIILQQKYKSKNLLFDNI